MMRQRIRRTAATIAVAAGMMATVVATPASAHTIRCGATAYQPVKSGTAVVATAIVSCTDRPDYFYAEYTMWAWNGSRYIGQGTKTYDVAPVPTQTYGIGAICRKGWIYHTEVEMWAYHHGSSDHAIANSQTTSPKMC